MSEVSIVEAKAKLSELVDRVAAGERVSITRRGKPVAVLGPAGRQLKPIDVEALRAFTKGMPRQKETAGKIMRRMRDDARY